MTVKGTSDKESSKPRPASSGVKAMDKGTSVEATASGKSSGGNRRTLGIVGCVVLALVVCCVASAAILWFSGDSIMDTLQNYLQ